MMNMAESSCCARFQVSSHNDGRGDSNQFVLGIDSIEKATAVPVEISKILIPPIKKAAVETSKPTVETADIKNIIKLSTVQSIAADRDETTMREQPSHGRRRLLGWRGGK
ncbi:hypothetical protein L2E82_05276 [Cichorium intybus]|uniref:Uncharacterized protein n=1 Tax=Cichorium intybus TaxID=13427 RepID=A0ACB9H6X0_CICIN|nr:hypothetical protein L2E82_05276 [Cichorium intybus]